MDRSPTQRRQTRSLKRPSVPQLRRGTVRISDEVAGHLRAGHPLVYREALGARPLQAQAGEVIEVVDSSGAFVARGLYDPDAVVALRIFTRDAQELIDPAAIDRRVERALALRGLRPEDITALRLINSEGDGVPGVTVDRYGDYLVAHVFTQAATPLLASLYDSLMTRQKPRGIYEQKRFKPQAGAGVREPAVLVRGELAPVEIVVQEGDLKFGVDVTAPLGTGLFPDLRLGRRAVRSHAHDRRVLNLFSYTGAFSLHAAKGGAREVVSVDLAAKAHARTRRNLELSGLPEQGHELIAGDSFKVLAKMAQRGRTFDLIILDPPSFAQTKERVFSIQRDYRELVKASIDVAARGAILCCASNTHKLSADDLDRAIGEASYQAGREVRVVGRVGLPLDFPVPAGYLDGQYLKFFVCAVD
jgi:23S rRNA (cytosine1962-C5)-methyltransferase